MRDRRTLPAGLVWRGSTIHIETTVGGRRLSRSCHTNQVAVARGVLDTLRGQIRTSDLIGVEPAVYRETLTLADFVAQELETLRQDQAAQRTLIRYRGSMIRFLAFAKRHLGREPLLTEVTPELVRLYKHDAATSPRIRNGSKKGIRRLPSPRTVANELDVLRVFFRRAVRRGVLPSNPEADIGRPKNAYEPRVRWLTDEEIITLLDAAGSWDTWGYERLRRRAGPLYRLIFEFYLRTGMRLDEFRHLTLQGIAKRSPDGRRILEIGPQQVRFSAFLACSQAECTALQSRGRRAVRGGRIAPEFTNEVCSQLTWREDLGLAVAPIALTWRPKSRARQMPLSRRAEEILQELLIERQRVLAEVPAFVQARSALRLPDPPWLVPDPTGLPWRIRLQEVITACGRKAGIIQPVRTHDLRHTFATQLRRRHVALETIQELLGHADIKETMMYAHFSLDEATRSIDLIDQAGRQPPAASLPLPQVPA